MELKVGKVSFSMAMEEDRDGDSWFISLIRSALLTRNYPDRGLTVEGRPSFWKSEELASSSSLQLILS
jgi:hypothetical protein